MRYINSLIAAIVLFLGGTTAFVIHPDVGQFAMLITVEFWVFVAFGIGYWIGQTERRHPPSEANRTKGFRR